VTAAAFLTEAEPEPATAFQIAVGPAWAIVPWAAEVVPVEDWEEAVIASAIAAFQAVRAWETAAASEEVPMASAAWARAQAAAGALPAWAAHGAAEAALEAAVAAAAAVDSVVADAEAVVAVVVAAGAAGGGNGL
jgi:hypothetical protein